MSAPDVTRIDVPMRRLLASTPDADPAVEPVRRLVHGSAPQLTLLRVALGDVRRYDIWSIDDRLVAVPYREDVDATVPCAVASGPSTTLLFGELMASARSDEGASMPAAVRFDDVGELVRSVTAGDAGLDGATVLHSRADDLDLVRVWGRRRGWGDARSGELLELNDRGDATYWGRALTMLRPVVATGSEPD